MRSTCALFTTLPTLFLFALFSSALCATTSRHYKGTHRTVGNIIFRNVRNPSLFTNSRQGNDGFSGESCTTDSDCAGERFCAQLNGEDIVDCPGTSDCACVASRASDIICSCESPECLPGDFCAMDNGSESKVCVSTNIDAPALDCDNSDSSEASTSEDVCIDANALSHLEADELVFEKHAVSRVLCDRFGSCATAGHIVHYMGSAMMMKKYCAVAVCEERVMEVNSPRYRKGIRVASKTDGLHYTAFAARYETEAEEAIMRTAVRLGL